MDNSFYSIHNEDFSEKYGALELYCFKVGKNQYEIKDDSKNPKLKEFYTRLFCKNEYQKIYLIKLLFQPATYFYVLIVCLLYSIYKRQKNEILVETYLFLYFLTCFLSPCAIIRYIYAIIVCVPVIVSLKFKNDKREKKMKLLMHTCCAPCSVYCIDTLREEGIEPTIYWYNPNIHPYMEYKARRDTLKEYAESLNLEVIFEEDYGLDEFCKNVVGDLQNRCKNYCYPVRLRKTFEYAKENGYDAVTTTLLYSIYQNHDFIKEYMEKLSKEFEIDFLYRDFRVGFREGQNKARELGLYMQKYCGCIFSEEDRYSKKIRRDKEQQNIK